MNNVVIDINKLYSLLVSFKGKEQEDDLFKHERAFYRGGFTAIQQVFIDNNYMEYLNEKLSEESK